MMPAPGARSIFGDVHGQKVVHCRGGNIVAWSPVMRTIVAAIDAILRCHHRD